MDKLYLGAVEESGGVCSRRLQLTLRLEFEAISHDWAVFSRYQPWDKSLLCAQTAQKRMCFNSRPIVYLFL